MFKAMCETFSHLQNEAEKLKKKFKSHWSLHLLHASPLTAKSFLHFFYSSSWDRMDLHVILSRKNYE